MCVLGFGGAFQCTLREHMQYVIHTRFVGPNLQQVPHLVFFNF